MNCEEFLAGYSDFLDQKFERHPLAEYCEHLLRCASCGEYDRVMRRGLQLVRQLEAPEPRRDVVRRVHRRILARARAIATRDARGWLGPAVAAAVGIVALTTIFGAREESQQVELPPVVVEARVPEPEMPSLFGPAPRFAPEANLVPVSGLANPLYTFRSEPLSLFRISRPRTSLTALSFVKASAVASSSRVPSSR